MRLKDESYSAHLTRLTKHAKRKNPQLKWQDAREAARTQLNNRMVYPSDAALMRHGEYVQNNPPPFKLNEPAVPPPDPATITEWNDAPTD